MNKIVYIGLVLFYAFIGILGFGGNAYIEHHGTERMLGNNVFLIILVSITLAAVAWHYFKKFFPVGYANENKAGKIIIPILFPVISFVLTTGILLFSNASFGHRETIRINGFIERKWYVHYRRSTDYFLGLRDSSNHRYYEFEVKKHIYEQVGNKGDKINKLFYKGSLGVIYRYNY